jgi:hypothetical protein
MCEKCDEIDAKTARYRGIARGVTDERALVSIESLIADLQTQKSLLHPKPEEK